MFNNIEFAYPYFFYLLILLVPIVAWYILMQNKIQSNLKISSFDGFTNIPTSIKYYLRHLLFVLKMAVAVLLIIGLARPQSTDSWKNITTEGIDIVMALDISTSMLAQDLKPDRLEAAKDVAQNFIRERKNDRIGLVVFAGESFTQCPLTTDHNVLVNLFTDIKTGMIEDGTAMGLGLANAVNRLKNSEAKSKVVILLTDGVNNSGSIPPLTAAEIAKTFDIRVYTIGVGSIGKAPFPVQTAFGVQMQDMDVKIDESTLQSIADETDGKYFRATDNNDLKNIYAQIDKLEKSKIDVKEFRKKNEEYLPYLITAISLLLLEILLRYTYLKRNH